MELSAFSHLTRRNVKVIQPGLVYIIEWAGGAGPPSPTLPTSPTAAAATASPSASSSSLSSLSTTASGSDGHTTTTRRRKDKDRHDLVDVIDVEGGAPINEGTIYVASVSFFIVPSALWYVFVFLCAEGLHTFAGIFFLLLSL